MAVTKKFSAAVVVEAYSTGLRHFGENYLQEFAAKRGQMGPLPEAKFHLIGHLQSNKARQATQIFQVVETVDSLKLLNRLEAVCGEQGTQCEALIEVKLSMEPTKTGATVEELRRIIDGAGGLGHVNVKGLMTVPPWSIEPEDSRPYFQQLSRLSREFELPELSMGMSGDFEVAIEEGATSIRVGTALFGARPKPGSDSAVALV